MLDDDESTTTTTAAAQPKKKKKKIITVIKKKKIKRIVPTALENGIDDENDVVPTNGHPPETPDTPESPPMPSPSRQRVKVSESCSSFASDDATAVGGETSEENGVKKTKRIVKVVRKVDAATIKREMRQLEEKNGSLKDENVALQTLIQSLEEKCHTQEQKIASLQRQLEAHQYLKSMQASRKPRRATISSFPDETNGLSTGVKINRPPIGGKHVTRLWEEKFKVFGVLKEA